MSLFLGIFERLFLLTPLVYAAYLSLVQLKVPFLALESAFVVGAACGALCACLFAKASFLSLVVSSATAFIGGGFVGLLVAMISFKGPKISFLLSNILVVGIAQSVVVALLNGSHKSLCATHNSLRLLPLVPRHPDLLIAGGIALMIVGLMFVFLHTQLAASFIVYGDNPRFFRYHHQSAFFVVAAGLGISGALAGLGGYYSALSVGFVDMYQGAGIVLLCITALVVGQALFAHQGKGLDAVRAVVVPLVGCSSYLFLHYGLVVAGLSQRYFSAINALAILSCLFFLSKRQVDSSERLGV